MKKDNGINLLNYESFYLDFLEGNLNEEEYAQFMAFLDVYPELKLDDENIVQLSEEENKLDKSFKQGLIMVDLEADEISLDNYEQFLFSEAEKTISQNGTLKIDLFVQRYPAIEKDRRLYALTRLKPSQLIDFPNKKELLHTRSLTHWLVLSAAAASILFAFLFSFFIEENTDNQLYVSHKIVEKSQKNIAKDVHHPLKQENQVKKLAHIEQNPRITLVAQTNKQDENNVNNEPLLELPKKELQLLEETVSTAHKNLVTRDFLPTHPITYTPDKEELTYSFAEMNNPIRPLTKRLEKITKTEIDFRLAKKTANSSGGFFIQIGTFELSHKTH